MRILISLSSAVDRYMEMFNSLPNIDHKPKYSSQTIKERIETQVKYFIFKYKKSNVVTQFCKFYKIALWHDYLTNTKSTPEQWEAYEKERKKYKVQENWTEPTLENFLNKMEHFWSLPLPRIKEYDYTNKSRMEIISDLEAIEEDWADSNPKPLKEYGDVILKFNDKSAWFNLNKEYCELEGDAMGHCGNAGDPKEGDRVLSYRTANKDGTWTPHLTFILKKNNHLGEMKGFKNQKPSDKYHPQIIALLKLPIIKGIDGGGYKPENNFELDDLSKSERDSLFAKKPILMSLEYISNNIKDHFDELVKRLKDSRIKYTLNGTVSPFVLFKTFESIEEYADEMEQSTLEKYLNHDPFDNEYSSDYDSNNISSFLYQLKKEHADVYKNLEQLAEQDESSIEEYVDNNYSHVLSSAVSDGYRFGAEAEMWRDIQSNIKSNGLEKTEDGKYQLWSSLSTALEILRDEGLTGDEWLKDGSELIPFVIKHGENDPRQTIKEVLDLDDLDVPYYGWNDYDEEAAFDSFFNLITDEL